MREVLPYNGGFMGSPSTTNNTGTLNSQYLDNSGSLYNYGTITRTGDLCVAIGWLGVAWFYRRSQKKSLRVIMVYVQSGTGA